MASANSEAGAESWAHSTRSAEASLQVTDAIRAHIEARKAWANIPPKRNRTKSFPFSTWLYRKRNLVERFFNRLKNCRRIATRYDKRQDNYIAGIKLIALRIWMQSYESTA